jgi:hypothetical protein
VVHAISDVLVVEQNSIALTKDTFSDSSVGLPYTPIPPEYLGWTLDWLAEDRDLIKFNMGDVAIGTIAYSGGGRRHGESTCHEAKSQ